MILNYTTTIEPEQTISEIQKMLSKHNVTGMYTEYDGHQVSAVSFKIMVGSKPMSFKLPCNWRAVLKVFNEQGIGVSKIRHKDKNVNNQAIRTAWRVMKVWIEAQLALIEINMVTLPQVFLPYTIMKDGLTLSEKITSDPSFLLGDGN